VLGAGLVVRMRTRDVAVRRAAEIDQGGQVFAQNS